MSIELTLATWPSQGRVGVARTGDWAGCHVFVFPEIWGYWAFYASDGTDDILPWAGWMQGRIELADIEWLSAEEDIALEREVFAMRPITRSQFDWPEGLLSRLRRARILGLGARRPVEVDPIEAWEARLVTETTKPDERFRR